MESRCPVALDPLGADIHAEGSRIRAQGPVARIELPGGVKAWSVTGHAAAREILSDHRFSKDGRRHFDAYVDGTVGEDFPLIGWVLMENMTTAYGADHTRLRKPCAHAFTPRRVEALRPAVEAITTELLDELAALPAGEPVDLKGLFAHPLPARAICDLFGVPRRPAPRCCAAARSTSTPASRRRRRPPTWPAGTRRCSTSSTPSGARRATT